MRRYSLPVPAHRCGRGAFSLAGAFLTLLLVAGCAPLVQSTFRPDAAFSGPRLDETTFTSFDGAHLPVRHWDAPGEPWAVVVGLHGMNDYSYTFHLAADYWAQHGVSTWAYDQRGFGGAPGEGIWAGEKPMVEDARLFTNLVRQRFPHAIIVVAGVSMGGSVVIDAAASGEPLAADRLILLSPGVWGWSQQPMLNQAGLWAMAHTARGYKVNIPAAWADKYKPTDNIAELRRMSRDPMMIDGARPDSIYGLVTMMDDAQKGGGALTPPPPAIYMYGGRDTIVPRHAALAAAARLPKGQRTVFYPDGYHLLLMDNQAKNVWDDILAFIKDPAGPLPSGFGPIPPPGTKAPKLPKG